MDDQSTHINSVTDHGEYIEFLLDGPQTADTMHAANLQLIAIAADYTAKNKPILVLASLVNMTSKFNPGAFKESLKTAEAVEYKRFAISGDLPHIFMTLVDGVINSFEHSFEVKYFPVKDEAIAWLKDYKPE